MSRKIKIKALLLVVVIVICNFRIVNYAREYDGSNFALGDETKSYVEKICIYSDGTYDKMHYYTVSCNTEIVVYAVPMNDGTPYYRFLSLEAGDIVDVCHWFNADGEGNTSVFTETNRSVSEADGYKNFIDSGWQVQCMNSGVDTVLYTTMYVFDSYNSALNYLKTGDMSGLAMDKSKEYDSENIYLNNFRVVYHDSNQLEKCYVEVKYDLPDYIKDNATKASLSVDLLYDLEYEFLAGTGELTAGDVSNNIDVDLQSYPNGFDLYFKGNIYNSTGVGIVDEFMESAMLGDEIYCDLGEIGIAEVTKSSLYMNFTPYIDGTYGMQSNAQVDLLNPSNTSFYSSKPDSSGNYTSNNDYTEGDGYYTTIVGTDGQGNPTYNYYYYDNSTHTTVTLDPSFDTDVDVGVGGDTVPEGSDVLTILWGNALTLNGSLGGSGSGGAGGSGGDVTINGTGDNIDITIEDDDYTDASLREDLRDGFGLLDNMQTDESSDGFLQLSAKFYEHLDGEFDDMLVFGMASVVVICILRSALRR